MSDDKDGTGLDKTPASPKDDAGKPDPENPAPTEPVRPAGPESMRDPPPKWDEVDEELDESFPASDPPSTY